MESELPENWIVTKHGELVELGDDLEKVWGFTIRGMREGCKPWHEFPRNWKSLDDFLKV